MLPFVPVSEAVGLPGLRLVLSAGLPGVSPSVPGPWGQAAKAFFDIKGIAYTPVAQIRATDDPALRQWTGQDSAPVAMYEDERPRSRWYEILQLAERLAPEPPMIPEGEAARAEMMGLAHSLMAEDGLAWNVRLFMLEGMARAGDPTVGTWSHRYGEPGRTGEAALARVGAVLDLLAERLQAAHARGSGYLIGAQLSALDIYWTCCSTLVAPFAQEICPMPDFYRRLGTAVGRRLGAQVHPALIEHRERILAEHIPLPLRF